jgi:hypothetical protein
MQLQLYQSIWGMEGLPRGAASPWTMAEALDRIADAGFDGISLAFDDLEFATGVARAAIERGLRIEAACFPTTVDELKPVLDTLAAVGLEHVAHLDIQPNVRPDSVAACVPYLVGWLAAADDAGVALLVETHRDRMTNDLLFTLQLLDAVPQLRLLADLSHYVVGQELDAEPSDAQRQRIRRILHRSGAYHGRIASSQQVQIPLSFPHHAAWVELFAGWWEEGFRHFRATAPEDAVLTFTTELGPPWYAITGPDGNELSDRWAEALQLAELARERWASAAD